MAHSPHRRWKGCQMCKPQKFRDQGRPERDPFSVRRKIGTKRRSARGEIPADQLDQA